LAACGLDCESCSIRRFPSDAGAVVEAIGWYREQGWLEEGEGVAEAIERKLICRGCHGDRTTHWLADCWIHHCCVDAKGLQHCSECETFPCDRLVQWAKTEESYGKAFGRLQELRGKSTIWNRRRGRGM
jgi:hypothetical protein